MIQEKINKSQSIISSDLKTKNEQIFKLKNQLENSDVKRNHLKTKIKKIKTKLATRYRHLYKKKNKQLFLFELLNPTSYIAKRKYFNIIKKFDTQNILNYSKLVTQIDSLNTTIQQDTLLLFRKVKNLNLDLLLKKKLISIEKKHELEFNHQKNERNKILNKIKQNKNLYKKLIIEKKRAAEKITQLIVKLEKKRKLREKKRLAKKPKMTNVKSQVKTKSKNDFFLGLNKNLLWPVPGKISAKFGKKRDRITRLVTFNPGIDIKCKKNSEIKAVANGEIVKVFWLRGYGNTIITDHGKGYYSVYSKIKKILVNKGDLIFSGKNIATASEENNFGEIHFEIWHNREKLDPTTFLLHKKL